MLAAAEEALLQIEGPRRRRPASVARAPWWRGPIGLVGSVVVLALIVAIVVKREVRVAPPPPPSTAAASPESTQANAIDDLLAQARRAYVAGKIAGAGDDNFRALLVKIEALEPNQLGASALRTNAVAEIRARAEAEAERGDLDRAIGDYRDLLALEPSDLEARPRLGQLLVGRAGAQPPLARAALVALLSEAIPLAADDPALHRTIADLLLANREAATAAKEYERVIELLPDDEAAQKGLVRARHHASRR